MKYIQQNVENKYVIIVVIETKSNEMLQKNTSRYKSKRNEFAADAIK